MKDSWSLACAIDQEECWHELVSAALYHLDIELGSHTIMDASHAPGGPQSLVLNVSAAFVVPQLFVLVSS